MGGPWLLLGRTFCPQGLLAQGSRETAGPWGEDQSLQVPRERRMHLARNWKTEGWVTVPTPRILGGWEAPPCRISHPLGLSALGPKDFRLFLGPGGREAQAAPGTRPALHRHPSALHHPHLMLSATPFTTAAWDPNGFHRGPAPARVGQDPTTPIALLAQSHHVPPVAVCVPASSLPVLAAASLLFVPCAPRSLLRSSPTNLSRPLSSPPSFLHLLPTGMSLGRRRAPAPLPLPLCALVSVSLCPGTSNSFRGADHLFPGCFAAVLMPWCGQNNSDFLIPSAVNLRSLLLYPLFLT